MSAQERRRVSLRAADEQPEETTLRRPTSLSPGSMGAAPAAVEIQHALESPLRLRMLAELFDAPEGLSLDRAAFLTGRPPSDIVACMATMIRWRTVETTTAGDYRIAQNGNPSTIGMVRAAVSERADRVDRERKIRREDLRGMLGVNPSMQLVYALISQVARMEVPVLVTGETGTGKELVARAIHTSSRRSDAPFVAVNCGTLTDEMFATEMLGHVKGAFTGAIRPHAGVFERAHGGTLFLDEIADLSLVNQVKMLRVLQEGTFSRVGDEVVRHTNLRIVSATNKDLAELVERNLFREDLYYRLNVLAVHLPPLRQRREDIAYILEDLLDSPRIRECWRHRDRPGFSSDAIDALERYHWPGNIRELENILMRALVIAGDGPIQAAEIEDCLARTATGRFRGDAEAAPPARPRHSMSLAEVEREHIASVFADSRGNLASAARTLGVSRTTLYRKLREFGLANPTEPDDGE